MFNDRRKAVFLPVCEKVLSQYKGFVLNDEMLPYLTEDQVYYLKEEFIPFETKNRFEKSIRFLLIVPFLPFVIIGALVDTYNKNERVLTFIHDKLMLFFSRIFKKIVKVNHVRTIRDAYDGIVEEDVPGFIAHCHSNYANIYLYSYSPLNEFDKKRADDLISNGIIHGIHCITEISDLATLIELEHLSIGNSLLVLLYGNENEIAESKKLGLTDQLFPRNIELWRKRNFEGSNSLSWNSRETLVSMKEYIGHYIYAKNNAYLDNKTVVFIEEFKDEVLNDYLHDNYEDLCRRFKEKGMRFIYFPVLKDRLSEMPKETYAFLKYRIPYLYNLSDIEIEDLVSSFIQDIDVQAFYSYFVNLLELPYFKRPCLLRSMSGGWRSSEHKYTYKHIEYESKEELDELFDRYFKQLRIPDDEEGVMYRKAKPPSEYDSDFYFFKDAFKDDPEFKEKIDKLKDQGSYGVLAEAIVYILATMKESRPDLLHKIQPIINRKTLASKAQLFSPILIDKDYKIFLTEYGNREIKLHSLSKTVYLFFLKNPNGVRFKELYMHKSELMELYFQISPKSDTDSMRQSIDDLVDMTNPSLNQKCSRIRQEIRSIIDEPLASYYYINGSNGENKKIKLDKNLIRFE